VAPRCPFDVLAFEVPDFLDCPAEPLCGGVDLAAGATDRFARLADDCVCEFFFAFLDSVCDCIEPVCALDNSRLAHCPLCTLGGIECV